MSCSSPHSGWTGAFTSIPTNASFTNKRKRLCRYWQLAGLPESKKEEWVNLEDVTLAREPMLTVAAQAAWGADDTWSKLRAGEQWPVWKHLRENTAPGFVADVQVDTLLPWRADLCLLPSLPRCQGTEGGGGFLKASVLGLEQRRRGCGKIISTSHKSMHTSCVDRSIRAD